MIDCEVKVIFSKDPNYIINSNSWPESVVKKHKEEQEAKLKARQTRLGEADKTTIPPPPAPVTQGRMAFINFGRPTTPVPAEEPKPQAPISENAENVSEEPEDADPQNEKTMIDKKERRGFLIQEMRRRIDQYFEINIRQVSDMVPKIITNFLINNLLVTLSGQNLLHDVQESK